MKCYNSKNCNNEVLDTSEYTAFCSTRCWKEYNNIKNDEAPKSNNFTIKELQNKCKQKAQELRAEKYKDFMTPVQGL